MVEWRKVGVIVSILEKAPRLNGKRCVPFVVVASAKMLRGGKAWLSKWIAR